MGKKYKLTPPSLEQRMFFEYVLLAEIDKQSWFSIVSLNLWNTDGLICIH